METNHSTVREGNQMQNTGSERSSGGEYIQADYINNKHGGGAAAHLSSDGEHTTVDSFQNPKSLFPESLGDEDNNSHYHGLVSSLKQNPLVVVDGNDNNSGRSRKSQSPDCGGELPNKYKQADFHCSGNNKASAALVNRDLQDDDDDDIFIRNEITHPADFNLHTNKAPANINHSSINSTPVNSSKRGHGINCNQTPVCEYGQLENNSCRVESALKSLYNSHHPSGCCGGERQNDNIDENDKETSSLSTTDYDKSDVNVIDGHVNSLACLPAAADVPKNNSVCGSEKSHRNVVTTEREEAAVGRVSKLVADEDVEKRDACSTNTNSNTTTHNNIPSALTGRRDTVVTPNSSFNDDRAEKPCQCVTAGIRDGTAEEDNTGKNKHGFHSSKHQKNDKENNILSHSSSSLDKTGVCDICNYKPRPDLDFTDPDKSNSPVFNNSKDLDDDVRNYSVRFIGDENNDEVIDTLVNSHSPKQLSEEDCNSLLLKKQTNNNYPSSKVPSGTSCCPVCEVQLCSCERNNGSNEEGSPKENKNCDDEKKVHSSNNGCFPVSDEFCNVVSDFFKEEDICESEFEPLLREFTPVLHKNNNNNNNNNNSDFSVVVMATQGSDNSFSPSELFDNGLKKGHEPSVVGNGFIKNKVGTASEDNDNDMYNSNSIHGGKQKNDISVICDGLKVDGVDGGSGGRYKRMASGDFSEQDKNNVKRSTSENDDNDNDDDDDGGPCGCGPVQMDYCQRFRSPGWFVLVITLFASCQGMAINGFVNTVISTLERRFGISSTEGGLIASCYDIMFVILVIPVSYFGGHGNKPRYLAVGSFVMGLGSFLFCLPHFLSENYHVSNAMETVCLTNGTSGDDYCDKNRNPDLSYYKYYFFLGQMLHGAGATALYTLAAVYVDENVAQRSSSAYNAVFYTGAIIGPALGYILGGEFLKIYTDISVDPKSLGLSSNNPRWVGAWWIGFLITGVFACLLSIPLLAFPPSLPGAKKFAAERGKEAHDLKKKDDTGRNKSIRDVLLSIRLLLLNIPFQFINLSAAADAILVSGFSTFLPKFIEYQYGKSAATAALYVGLAVVPAGGGATFMGGYVVTRFNLKVRGILRLCIVASATLIVLVFPFLLECETGAFAGITTPYGQKIGSADNVQKRLDATCNAGCGCVEENYYPMCGRDGVMYFSPCYAGCSSVNDNGNVKYYSNCTCVQYNLTAENLASGDTEMGRFGKCDHECKWLSLFMVMVSIQMALIFITSMPSLTATLRCVPDHQRSFGLGIQWIVARCLGSIPGPILFGKMFDMSCSLWQKKCESSGSCFFYDNTDMRIYLLILSGAFAIAAAISFFLAYWFYVPKAEDPSISLEVQVKKSTSLNTVTTDTTSTPATPDVRGDDSPPKY